MGIHGLLPQLKSIMVPIHVKELRGQCVAVDTYSWLHKGALSCSRELCNGLPTSRHIDYCMHRVNLLRHYGVKPLLVFDGGLLPMKGDQEAKRARVRKDNLERATEHELAGNSAAAYECYQKAVDISPSIALQLIQILKKENVDFIVAPYEADAQMTFLSINNHVGAVITEDSDLIPFGCSRIIFKMDKFGQGVEFRSETLSKNKDLSFLGFTKMMFLEMCIFRGCDYLQSLPGMGLKKAYTLIQNFKNSEKAIKHLKFNTVSVPPQYEDAFRKAVWTFLHQRVYDPCTEDAVHLSDIPEELSTDCDFLGPWLPQDIAKGIAKGDIDPITKMPFQVQHASNDTMYRAIGVKEVDQARERKKLHLPVQKNTLTNYFCLATIEAKRKFKAPQIKPSVLAPRNGSSYCSQEDISKKCQPDNAAFSIKFSGDRGRETTSSSDNVHLNHYVGDGSENKENHPIQEELLTNPRGHSLFFQSKSELNKPFLASHKKHGSDPVEHMGMHEKPIDGRAISGASKNSRLLDESDGNDDGLNEALILESEDHAAFSCKSSLSEDVQVDKNRCGIAMIKRKRDCQTFEQGYRSKSMKNTELHSPTKGVSLNCDISHLERYSGISEESMKRFVSVISAFNYTPKNGSRVSGLRAPLKDVRNTSINRSMVPLEGKGNKTTSSDLSRFAYVSKGKHAPASTSKLP